VRVSPAVRRWFDSSIGTWTGNRRQGGPAGQAARGLGVVVLALAALGAATASAQPKLSESAAPAGTRIRIYAANAWFDRTHDRPCESCMVRPPGSTLLWTFYENQGIFPNWVRSAREVLRRKARGDRAGFVAGAHEIISFSTVRRAPGGLVFRVNESAYTAPDGHPAPWRDAMSNAIALTLVPPLLDADPSAPENRFALRIATEYLAAFDVRWQYGGLVAPGRNGGRWYLEYAYAGGARARVLNGFMQSLVSLERFAHQANLLVARGRPEWAALRNHAQLLVRLGAKVLVRRLPQYDLGDGWSLYSLARPGHAPPSYHRYHRQLLERLERIRYLPLAWRVAMDDVRVRWGGIPNAVQIEPTRRRRLGRVAAAVEAQAAGAHRAAAHAPAQGAR
jgi:D-glucuronyl C5-epimerase C-terminus